MLPDPSEKEEDKQGLLQPDPGTKNTTDPQEHMEGPISSLMQKADEGLKEDGGKTGSDPEPEK